MLHTKVQKPGNCSKESTKDVAEKSKSDPRDKVPPGAEVEEVEIEPVFCHLPKFVIIFP